MGFLADSNLSSLFLLNVISTGLNRTKPAKISALRPRQTKKARMPGG